MNATGECFMHPYNIWLTPLEAAATLSRNSSTISFSFCSPTTPGLIDCQQHCILVQLLLHLHCDTDVQTGTNQQSCHGNGIDSYYPLETMYCSMHKHRCVLEAFCGKIVGASLTSSSHSKAKATDASTEMMGIICSAAEL